MNTPTRDLKGRQVRVRYPLSAASAADIGWWAPRERSTWQNLRQTTLFRLARNPLGFLGLLIATLLALAAFFPSVWATHNPYRIEPVHRLLPPSAEHLFGTDELGRDVFSRVIHGTRISLAVALGVIAATAAVGTLVGMVAAYLGGAVDEALMRFADVFISFPGLIMAMGIVALLGANLRNAMLTLIVIWWPQYARLARGQTLRIKQLLYIEAARATGSSGVRILRHHIFPNILQPILVKASLDVGLAILTTASLSFLGLGARPPSPELGSLVTQGRTFLLTAWWYATFPGLVIFLSVLGFNLLGDSLRDVLDPTLREIGGQ